jgi:5-bromo-4-chloroindolyl phosphate hydrolysis protein
MIDFDITDLLLGVVSVLLAYSTFVNNRRKDSKNAGAQEATLHADIKYIKELLQDVRSEMKELTKTTDRHAERITKCETQLVAAFESIKRIEQQIDIHKEE